MQIETMQEEERRDGAPGDEVGAQEPSPAADQPEGTAPAEPAAPTAREAELQAELEDTKERLLRALADMENLRRRTQRDVEDARRYAISGFARELLDVADNLSRALASIPPRAREKIDLIKNLAEGVEMTEKALLGVFERHQIAQVAPEPGEKFDHNRHQAMFEVESDQPPGTIAQVLQPGYTIADRLLRPVMVAVARAPSGQPTGDGASGGAEPAAAEQADDRPEPANESRPGGRVDTTA